MPSGGAEESSKFTPNPIDELWPAIVEVLKENTKDRPKLYSIWFCRLKPHRVDDETIRLLVPNKFFKDWIEKNYTALILDAVEAVLGVRLELVLKIAESRGIDPVNRANPAEELEQEVEIRCQEAPQPIAARRVARRKNSQLNIDYTFPNFVIGPRNRMAHAVSLAVADAPGCVYNPLFLHGGVGLGKTHLLQAACHKIGRTCAPNSIVYLSCETFVNQYIQAAKEGKLESFRHRYRYAEVLAVDDIHFLAGKERTQEEFFHTFNSLYQAKKQIILSSDSHPKDITSVEERLVSRFKWGMVAQLEPPTYETRVAILEKKAALKGVTIPEKIVEYIAENIDTNIRELEGAVVKVLAYTNLSNQPLTLELAKEALQDSITVKRRTVFIADIQSAVAEHFNLKQTDLQSKKRSHAISHPRHIAMFLARALTDMSYKDIGTYFGGRDHSTVMYAEDKVRTRLEADDAELKWEIDTLTRAIQARK